MTFKKRLNRFKKRLIIKYRRNIKNQRKIKFPKKYDESEKTASVIFLKILKDPNTKLYYNIKTYECYLRSDELNIYIFLESRNMKILNSIYGYDVTLSDKMEHYLSERFQQQMSKRRNEFKEEALSKVQFSLEKTLKKVKKTGL